MPVIDPLRRRLREPIRSERGMALPVALFGMIASMALAGAAVVATVDVQQGSHRDNSSKSAIAAADAGANVARLRLARYATVLATQPCLRVGGGGTLEGTVASSDGWCPEVAGTVGGASYVYRVTPAGTSCATGTSLCVVSSGTADGVTRRIEVTYDESPVLETIEEEETGEESSGGENEGSEEEEGSVGVEGLIGIDGIELSGNADVRVGIGTNGDVTGVGNASVCGDIRHGIGKANTADQCNGYAETEGNKSLPPVSSFMPSDIATNNSNYRLVKCTKTKPTKEPTGCELDTYTGTRNSTKPWDATARAISLSGNSTLTLSGGDYWVCSLSLSGNSQLIAAAGSDVRLFFDTPENCGLSSGTAQIAMSGNNRISSTGYLPSEGKFSMPGFYLLGSTTMTTNVNITGNAGTVDEFIIYGPNTTINISGNGTYKGVIAGKRIVMVGNGKVEQDSGFQPPAEIRPITEKSVEEEGKETSGEGSSTTITIARYFEPQSYVECSGDVVSGLPPNANC